MFELTRKTLLHQHKALSDDIQNRDKIVWTIGGILIPASFLLIAYSLSDIENIYLGLFGGIISIAFLWFFHYLDVRYSHINHIKILIRDRIECELGLRSFNRKKLSLYAYKHDPTFVGWAQFIIYVFIIHFLWSFIWIVIGFQKQSYILIIIGKVSLFLLLIGIVWIVKYNNKLKMDRKDLENKYFPETPENSN
jgi:hypothetical protein